MAGPVPAELVALAGRMADAVRPIAKRYFRTQVAIDDKVDASPVTIADREAETVMRELLTAAVPDHGVIGEEHGAVRRDADYVWVLDPIDGTKAFITGLPIFGTLIALLHRGKPVLGVIDQPIMGERWLGVSGQATTFNGQPIRTRACPTLDQAYMYSTAPIMFPGAFEKRHEALTQQVKLFRWGGDWTYTDPMHFEIPTPVAMFETISLTGARATLQSGAKRFDLDLPDVTLTAQAGSFKGKSNVVSGTVKIGTTLITVPQIPLDPSFIQGAFDQGYVCTQDLKSVVSPN